MILVLVFGVCFSSVGFLLLVFFGSGKTGFLNTTGCFLVFPPMLFGCFLFVLFVFGLVFWLSAFSVISRFSCFVSLLVFLISSCLPFVCCCPLNKSVSVACFNVILIYVFGLLFGSGFISCVGFLKILLS